MKELSQWWNEVGGSAAPWLVIGKGPTFARRGEFDISPYRTISLNQVVREFPVEVAHVADLEVLRDCAESFEKNARFLLMPRIPHQKFVTSGRTLESLFDEIPVLQRMDKAGRLVWYNLASSEPMSGSPLIPMGYFTGEVVINLLGILGARHIRSLGIDGGTHYSSQFKSEEQTRLANGRDSFDLQNEGIARAIQKFQLDYAPPASECPARIFIGTDESQLLGAKVFEYSVRRTTTVTTTFDTMMHVKAPFPQDPKNQARTGFSFNRFAIPQLAGYKGRAAYVDADMLVFRDFREVWDLPFNGAKILYAPSSDPARPKQFSVMLLDCENLKWDLDEIISGLDENRYDYDGLMKELCIESPESIQPRIPPAWNSLEEYTPGQTGLIHYTDMPQQPWVFARNPNGDTWVWHLREAMRDGFISAQEIREAARSGHVRPSLLWQLRVPRRSWPQFKRYFARVLDRNYQSHQDLNTRFQRTGLFAAKPSS